VTELPKMQMRSLLRSAPKESRIVSSINGWISVHKWMHELPSLESDAVVCNDDDLPLNSGLVSYLQEEKKEVMRVDERSGSVERLMSAVHHKQLGTETINPKPQKRVVELQNIDHESQSLDNSKP
jgi:hypothetical protein